jgi:hypothetical protein
MSTLMNAKDWVVVSQDPNIASPSDKAYAEKHYLPELVHAWQCIERYLGYRWKSTSYWRRSPSHHKGIALDIAPDVSPSSATLYAVTNQSDPVLYKRTQLIRGLQAVAREFTTLDPTLSIGVFIEPDHLHMQVFERSELFTPMRIVKWKVAKPCYPDTYDRMRLPMM